MPIRTYLDQNKWIDLAKRAKKSQDDPLLWEVEHAAIKDRAAFPLSRSHHMEIYNQGDRERRRDLVEVMFRLADPQSTGFPETIAPYDQLFSCEIDRALNQRFGVPTVARIPAPFGRGLGHAYGDHRLDVIELPDIPVPSSLVEIDRGLRTALQEAHQCELWVKMPFDALDDDLRESAEKGESGYQDVKGRFVTHENDLAQKFEASRWSKSERDEYLAADTLQSFGALVDEALAGAGLDAGAIAELGVEGWIKLIRDVPICHVYYELRCLRHDNPHLRTKRNDMEDLSWISAAVVYCDVVVMEKHWAHLIRRANLDRIYDTAILTSIVDLPAHLG